MAITPGQAGGFPVPGDTCIFNAYAYQSPQIGIIGCHAVVTAVTTGGATAGEIALAVGQSIETNLALCMSSTAQILGYRFGPVFTGIGLPFLAGNALSTAVGTGGDVPLPGQVTGIIRKLSLFSGVSRRGRTYIPFPSTAHVGSGDTPNTTYKNALAGLANLWFASPETVVGVSGTTQFSWVIYTREGHGVRTINIGSPGTKFATQKRRGNYGIPNNPIVPG